MQEAATSYYNQRLRVLWSTQIIATHHTWRVIHRRRLDSRVRHHRLATLIYKRLDGRRTASWNTLQCI